MVTQMHPDQSSVVVDSGADRITIDLKPLMIKQPESSIRSTILIEMGQFEIEIRPSLKSRPQRSISITHLPDHSIKPNKYDEKSKASHAEWDYSPLHGPNMWHRMFPNLQYKRYQSPIRIFTDLSKYESMLTRHPLIFQADENCCQTLENMGHAFQVTGKGYSYITRGPVHDEYRFLQFHMHWGANDSEGSEHVIDGIRRPAEIHIVTWNTTKYKKPEEAMASEKFDGLLVFAILVKVIPEDNRNFVNLFNLLPKIKYKGQKIDLEKNVMLLKHLMPDNLQKYYTYDGSLTTPMCNECVRWIVFKDPIGLSRHQLLQLRRLKNVDKYDKTANGYIIRNFRPAMPLNGRIVHRSFV